MELFGVLFGLGIAAQVVIWGIVGLAFPLFWLWMLVDAILRREDEYPTTGANDKVIWIIVIALFQVASVVYFFMVFRRLRRSPAVAPTPAGA